MNIFNKKRLFSIVVAGTMLTSTINISLAANTFKRISGANRTETSVETAKMNTSDTLVVASGEKFADILSATNIVNRYNAKLVLYTRGSNIGNVDLKPIKRIFVVNTHDGLHHEMYSKVKERISNQRGINLISVTGINKYETNKKTLEITGYKNVGVASGEIYPDALCAYPLLKEKNMGLMLVKGDAEYDRKNVNVIFTFGGSGSVMPSIGERIAGRNRYETSVNIAKRTNVKNISFVSGENYPDAMSAINVANSRKSDILLAPKSLNAEVTSLARSAGEIFAVGGVGSLADIYVDAAIRGSFNSNKPNKNTANNKPVISNNSGFVTTNHKSGLFSVSIPKKYADRFVIKHEYVEQFNTYQISIYSKYHYKYNSDFGSYEGQIAMFDIGDMNQQDNQLDHTIGFLKRGNQSKKMILAIPTDVTTSDYSDKSMKIMQENIKIIMRVAKNNIKGINGTVYKKVNNSVVNSINY